MSVKLIPDQASAMAYKVDSLFMFLTAVTGSVAVVTFLVLLVFIVRYRRRAENQVTPRISGWIALEVSWTVAPFFIFLIMFIWGAILYFEAVTPPVDAEDIYITGKQWMWKAQHVGGQREINQLHLAIDHPVRLILTSEDVIHDFFVPAFRTKVDVLPGRYVQTWYLPTKAGSYHLFCSEYCGTGHSTMLGNIVVQSRDRHSHWLEEKAEGSMVLEGRKIFLKYECNSCHSADSSQRCPLLEGIYGRTVVLSQGNRIVADENYLRNSILDPNSQVVQGWKPIMPTFKGMLTEAELMQLVAYLKALKRGDTPSRNERSMPPVQRNTPDEGGGNNERSD